MFPFKRLSVLRPLCGEEVCGIVHTVLIQYVLSKDAPMVNVTQSTWEAITSNIAASIPTTPITQCEQIAQQMFCCVLDSHVHVYVLTFVYTCMSIYNYLIVSVNFVCCFSFLTGIFHEFVLGNSLSPFDGEKVSMKIINIVRHLGSQT